MTFTKGELASTSGGLLRHKLWRSCAALQIPSPAADNNRKGYSVSKGHDEQYLIKALPSNLTATVMIGIHIPHPHCVA